MSKLSNCPGSYSTHPYLQRRWDAVERKLAFCATNKRAWKAWRAETTRTLRRLTGEQLVRAHVIAQPGRPLPITLRPGRGEQTIFMFRPDGTLFGKDYPPGDNVMVITAGVDFDDPKNVLISGTPVIRTKRRFRQYVRGPTGYVLANRPIHFRLEEMSFQFNVPPGGFLMIGPGPEVKRSTSPGRHFLTGGERGERFEMLMVIAPEVFSAAARLVKPKPIRRRPTDRMD